MEQSWRKRYKFWLMPLTWGYQFGVAVRNKMYDIGVLKSKEFPIPVLCIGNITVGGTGKTPHTEHIIRILMPTYKVAVVSRGYKRNTKGFLEVQSDSDVRMVGDEPLQIKSNFPGVRVFVDANRTRAIEKLMAMEERFDVILLDDGFQHRAVTPGLTILLMDYNRPVYEDDMLPAGDLRESVNELRRAEILVVTKSPEKIKPMEQRIISSDLKLYPYQDLFFTTYTYGNLVGLFNNKIKFDYEKLNNNPVLLVTGIAQPSPLLAHIQKYTNNIKHLAYPDHHAYSPADIKNIEKEFEGMPDDTIIITTQKDANRLAVHFKNEPAIRNKVFYIPIEVTFITEDKEFTKHILDYVGKNKRKRSLHTDKN